MNLRKWRRPINFLMITVLIVSGILIFLMFTVEFSYPAIFLLIPVSLSGGFLFEDYSSRIIRPPIQSLIRLRSLLFPVGGTILFLITEAMQDEPVLTMLSQPMFWVYWSSMIISWLIGTTLFRHLHMSSQENTADF